MNNNAIEQFISAVKEPEYETNTTYSAIVSRVDSEGVVWVNLAGSEKETPTASTSADVKAGDVVTVQWRNNQLYIAGNYSNPSAGSIRVNAVELAAQIANQAATNAVEDAGVARAAAEDAKATADSVHGIAVQAQADADEAKTAAGNASEYAARALGNLSTVQSVTETLTWITQHGTMTLTTDVALDPTHVYFVQDAGGDYVVGGVTYAVVTEPDVADIGTYYELSIDESLNNYVGTHLALTSEGLWLIPEVGGNKVLIATGGVGHTYEDAGTYIIDGSDNVLAQFLENGAQVGQSGGAHSVIDADGQKLYANDGTKLIAHLGYNKSQSVAERAPYFILGERGAEVYSAQKTYYWGDVVEYNDRYYLCIVDQATTPPTGASWDTLNYTTFYYTTVEGYQNMSAKSYCHAEGYKTVSSNSACHSEGWQTVSGGFSSHAEGCESRAAGAYSHAQNYSTRASKRAQTSIGTYNTEDTSTTTTHPSGDTSYGEYALIVGNGTANNARANALTVDWDGRIECGDYAGNFKSIFDIFYPKGSYYETSLTNAIPSGNDTPNATDLQNLGITWFDPNYAWGGTWELETSGKFHISAGTGYGLGTGGGSPDAVVVKHNHTQNPHNHTQNAHHHIAFKYKAGVLPTGTSGAIRVWDYAHSGDSTANTNDVTATNIQATAINIETGVDGTGKNLPPYVAVNRWHRTG